MLFVIWLDITHCEILHRLRNSYTPTFDQHGHFNSYKVYTVPWLIFSSISTPTVKYNYSPSPCDLNCRNQNVRFWLNKGLASTWTSLEKDQKCTKALPHISDYKWMKNSRIHFKKNDFIIHIPELILLRYVWFKHKPVSVFPVKVSPLSVDTGFSCSYIREGFPSSD